MGVSVRWNYHAGGSPLAYIDIRLSDLSCFYRWRHLHHHETRAICRVVQGGGADRDKGVGSKHD